MYFFATDPSTDNGKRMSNRISRLLGLIIALHALPLTPANCGSVVPGEGNTLFYTYNMTKQPTSAEDYDEVAALASMQGIINRDNPILYITNQATADLNTGWTSCLKDGRWLNGREKKAITDLDAVYRLAADKLKGAVIWDTEVPATINVATTIAGVEDAVVFSPDMAEKYLRKWNLPVIKDLRGMFTGKETGSKKNDAYRWAIREYIDRREMFAAFLMFVYGRFLRSPSRTDRLPDTP